MAQQFPADLIQRYLNASNKLKKFERVVFKRFAPNVAEVSNDFSSLAGKFEDAFIYQYAAMCYLGSAKCEKSLGNSAAEIEFLLKAARLFVKADDETEKLGLKSNQREYLEGALKSYHEALIRFEDDSPMKAAIIREIRKINPNCEQTSSFSSPCHRCYDLESSANENIHSKDYCAALDKLTEIFENIMERKVQKFYEHVIERIEITRLLLLLLLNLPPCRQSPSHIKLLEKYTNTEDPAIEIADNDQNSYISSDIKLTLKDLALSCCDNDKINAIQAINQLLEFNSLNEEQILLLHELATLNKI